MPLKLKVKPEIPYEARPYADAREKEEMGDNHPQAVKRFEEFLQIIPNHRKFRACEVGCGNGLLTCDFLQNHYEEIYMFDAKEDAIAEA